MKWRIGLIDVCAVLLLLVVLFLPAQDSKITGAFEHRGEGDKARNVDAELLRVGELQAALWENPANAQAADALAAKLSDLGRHDMAVRAAGFALKQESHDQWRVFGALSDAYADRIDIPASLSWTKKAIASCEKVGKEHCPAHEALRLQIYSDQLERGMQALEKGADPKFDPDGFRRELAKTYPTTR